MKKDYLIIDRSRWRTGGLYNGKNQTGFGGTFLLNSEGFMCCLGFRCHQMGIPKKDLLDKQTPLSIATDWDIPDLIDSYGKNSAFTAKAVKINDDNSLTSEEREKRITEHFATIGVTVEFKGKYVKP
jgi:hypothetical protein